MDRVTLEKLHALVIHPENRLDFLPMLMGARERRDSWSAKRWKRIRDHHILFVVSHGEVRLSWNSKRSILGPDTAFLLGPSARPDISFSSLVRFHEVYFAPYFRKKALGLTPDVQVIEQAADIPDLLDRLASAVTLDGLENNIVARHYLGASLAIFHRLSGESIQRKLSPSQRSRVVRHAQEHLTEKLTPSDLARVLSLSPDYFTRVFSATLGLSPRDWLVRERMRSACRLLSETNLTVYAIAERLGYEDVPHFCRQFRKVIGYSPGKWRQES